MRKVIIIGLGQIGSRHLQSLAQVKTPLEIYGVDPSIESLDVAKQRFFEVDIGNVKFKPISEIPKGKVFDFAIVATSSLTRFTVTKQLIESNKIKNILLEKVLFAELPHYKAMSDLLNAFNVNAWVNCPMRSYPIHYQIRKKLDNSDPVKVTVEGMEWGLGCNSMHFIDLVNYFTNTALKTVDSSELIPNIFPSKRSSYIEIYGQLKCIYENENSLNLECVQGDGYFRRMVIDNGKQSFVYDDSRGVVTHTIDGALNEEIPYRIPFQSELTGKVCEDVIGKNTCELISYADSADQHYLYVSELLRFLSKISGQTQAICNIT